MLVELYTTQPRPEITETLWNPIPIRLSTDYRDCKVRGGEVVAQPVVRSGHVGRRYRGWLRSCDSWPRYNDERLWSLYRETQVLESSKLCFQSFDISFSYFFFYIFSFFFFFSLSFLVSSSPSFHVHRYHRTAGAGERARTFERNSRQEYSTTRGYRRGKSLESLAGYEKVPVNLVTLFRVGNTN